MLRERSLAAIDFSDEITIYYILMLVWCYAMTFWKFMIKVLCAVAVNDESGWPCAIACYQKGKWSTSSCYCMLSKNKMVLHFFDKLLLLLLLLLFWQAYMIEIVHFVLFCFYFIFLIEKKHDLCYLVCLNFFFTEWIIQYEQGRRELLLYWLYYWSYWMISLYCWSCWLVLF